MKALAARPEMRALLSERCRPLPPDIVERLSALRLLEGLPFNNIVAQSEMLPPESIRFFHVDANWTAALLNGALSVAHLDEAHRAVIDALRRPLIEAADAQASVKRRLKRGVRRTASGGAAGSSGWTGLLLRSALVSDCPGVTLRGFADPGRGQKRELLRFDRLSPSVLLALFDGPIAALDFTQPEQSLHFGLTGGSGHHRVHLRALGDGICIGESLKTSVDVPFRTRADGRLVLDVGALHATMTHAIAEAYAHRGHAPPPEVGPAAVALELVAGALRQPFETDALAVGPLPGEETAETAEATWRGLTDRLGDD